MTRKSYAGEHELFRALGLHFDPSDLAERVGATLPADFFGLCSDSWVHWWRRSLSRSQRNQLVGILAEQGYEPKSHDALIFRWSRAVAVVESLRAEIDRWSEGARREQVLDFARHGDLDGLVRWLIPAPYPRPWRLAAAFVGAGLLGMKLGEGSTRVVFALPHFPEAVAKFESSLVGGLNNANIAEFKYWKSATGTSAESWLAPCLAVDDGGFLLLQARTGRIDGRSWPRLFRSTPPLLHEPSPGNWGWYQGRLVCHDYALAGYEFASSAWGSAQPRGGEPRSNSVI